MGKNYVAAALAGDFAFCVNLLVPLYAARATEEVLYGKDAVTMQSAVDIGNAGELARWLCIHSQLNPGLFGLKVKYDDRLTLTQYMPMRTVRVVRSWCCHCSAHRCCCNG